MVSPSLWWADAAIIPQVTALTGFTEPLDIYLTAGELEETIKERVWPPLPADMDSSAMTDARMVTNLRAFAAALRALDLPDLTVHAEILQREHRITLWPAAFSRGLLALHAPTYRLDG